jgi:Arc/MetJ-type ribon-helix-helix transcriptional regulator
MATQQRMASFRRQKKAEGYKQFTTWLSPEDERAIRVAMERNGLKNQAEVIRFALRKISTEEPQMQP